MSVKITYFVHGTTTDNENGISTGGNPGELSQLGIEQSKKLREQTQDRKFDVVFCSDQKRAMDSANLAFGRRFKIISDERLRECNYGKLNAKLSEVVEPMCELTDQKFPDGESYEEVKDRVKDFLKYLKQNYEGKSVALMAHKAPQLALEVLLNHKSWEQAFEQDWRKTPPSLKLRRAGKSWQPGWNYVVE